MKNILTSAFYLFFPVFIFAQLTVKNSDEVVVSFGSCNKVDLDQPLWEEISKNNIDLFIWAGDNIYADTENMSAMRNMYNRQKSLPDYKNFSSKHQIIGTWDDHDYGENDAGKRFKAKEESRDLALEFLEVPRTDPVWNHDGIYQSYQLGENVKIVILDTRYFRDDLIRDGKSILPDDKGDVLGKEQWKWLEKELSGVSNQTITLIVSSIQVLPTEQPYEKWNNFPSSREKLLDLLWKKNVPNVVFLSGDRHMGEISKLNYKAKTYYEITSSGLTHIWQNMPHENNQYRIGRTINQLNFGLIRLTKGKTGTYKCDLELRGEGNELLLKEEIYPLMN